MRLRGRIELVPALDDRVDDVRKDLEALLVATGEAHAKVGPEHTSLHAVGQGVALGALLVLELVEQILRHVLAHQRLVIISKRRQLREGDVLELVRVLGVVGRRFELTFEQR